MRADPRIQKHCHLLCPVPRTSTRRADRRNSFWCSSCTAAEPPDSDSAVRLRNAIRAAHPVQPTRVAQARQGPLRVNRCKHGRGCAADARRHPSRASESAGAAPARSPRQLRALLRPDALDPPGRAAARASASEGATRNRGSETAPNPCCRRPFLEASITRTPAHARAPRAGGRAAPPCEVVLCVQCEPTTRVFTV
jgi:hypothetical protein